MTGNTKLFEYQNFVIESLIAVSKIASNNFGKVTSTVKEFDHNQVLTQTDLEIGNLLVERIQSTYPSHNVIDEEAGVIDKKSNFTWVVDPIDGTSNFANGIPMYGILIGLLEGDLPIAGGIALPSQEEIYYAEKDMGAFCNGRKVFVSTESKLANSLISYGIDGHPEKPELTHKELDLLKDITLNIRNLRTSNSAFDFAMVARGAYGAYLNQTSKIWDNVAPNIIIEEAGGIYTDFYGNKMDYHNPLSKTAYNFTYISGAPELHPRLIEIVKNHRL